MQLRLSIDERHRELETYSGLHGNERRADMEDLERLGLPFHRRGFQLRVLEDSLRQVEGLLVDRHAVDWSEGLQAGGQVGC